MDEPLAALEWQLTPVQLWWFILHVEGQISLQELQFETVINSLSVRFRSIGLQTPGNRGRLSELVKA